MADLWTIGALLLLITLIGPSYAMAKAFPQQELLSVQQVQARYERRAQIWKWGRVTWFAVWLYTVARGLTLIGIRNEVFPFAWVFVSALSVAVVVGFGAALLVRIRFENQAVRRHPELADCVPNRISLILQYARIPLALGCLAVTYTPQSDLVTFSCLVLAVVFLLGFQKLGLRFAMKSNSNLALDSMLGQRVSQLLSQFAIQPKRIVIMPRFTANGWAMSNGVVVLTSAMRHLLTDDEVLAVLAHELSHIRDRDSRAINLRRIGSYILCVIVVIGVAYFMAKAGVPTDAWAVFLGLSVLPVLIVILWSSAGFCQRQEFKCDADAKRLGLGEALASGLEKVYRYNRVPERWVGVDRILASHPPLVDRVERLRD